MPKLLRFVVPFIVTAIVMGAGVVLMIPSGAAQADNVPPGASVPALAVGPLLNSDGTLDTTTGASGALDVRGWNVTLDPQKGPVFSPANRAPSGDATWSRLGNGLNDQVLALAVSGGNVYVGGYFTEVCGNAACNSGNTPMNRIARWDGSQWHALGHGVSDNVRVLAVSGGNVYVGGYFTEVCGNDACDSGNTIANSIARWDGSQWHALGHGVNDNVRALAVSGGDIFVGGYFTQVCGNDACDSGNTTVNSIARWDGSQWHTLGYGVKPGVYSNVSALAVSGGDDLYVAGLFQWVCENEECNTEGTIVNNIARWDGSQWHALGYGVDVDVEALAISGDDLYAGGGFEWVCENEECNTVDNIVNNIARWDGSQWHALEYGLRGPVHALAVSGEQLYAGGSFDRGCDSSECKSGPVFNFITSWDGSQWRTVGSGVGGGLGGVYALAASGGDVYVGGDFTRLCGNVTCNSANTTAFKIAKYSLSTPPTPTSTPPVCSGKPGKPDLQKPANNATVTKAKVKLNWSDATCVTDYQVIVKNTATGKKVFKAVVADSKAKTGALPPAEYQWSVKARNAHGVTKSTKFKFTK